MAKRSLLNVLNTLIHRLPHEGTDVADALKSAGVKAHQAGQLLGTLSDPGGTFLRGAQALVEGRVGIEVVDGRVGLKIHERDGDQEDDGGEDR
jgi:hypothetical protein